MNLISTLKTCFCLTIAISQSITTSGQELRIDHVITVVPNLDEAIDEYGKMGFSVKKGRLHDNGLTNAHIKFQNQSSIELMSIVGEPKDEMARNYQSLLNAGIKGAYLALSGLSLDSIEVALIRLSVKYEISKDASWTYVTFPDESEYHHIFFIIYHSEHTSLENLFKHQNKVDGFENIKIEGSNKLTELFEEFGLKPVITESHLSSTFPTKTGSITVIPQKTQDQRYQVVELSFDEDLKLKLF
ncbi:MAG: VOC family protein [Ekhidna sp.]|uniref:VOC family protein n=1 Tax=Ekhidna sp. TaxID=2608089 RepID=UPI0032EE3784